MASVASTRKASQTADTWPAWTDQVWTLGPDPGPSLTLTLAGVPYGVTIHPSQCPDVRRVIRLAKREQDHATYDVADHTSEPATCTCPDYEFKHRDHGTACKHVAALVKLGLLPPSPAARVPMPQPAPRRARHADDLGVVPPARKVEAPAPVPARENVPDEPDPVEPPLPPRPARSVPTEADWADYARWSQEREEAALREQIERDAAREEVMGVLIPGRNLWFDGCIPAAVAAQVMGRATLGPSREQPAWD